MRESRLQPVRSCEGGGLGAAGGGGGKNAFVANATGVAVATRIAIVFTYKLIPSEGRIRCCLGAAEITQPINSIKNLYANNNKSGCGAGSKEDAIA